MTTLLIRDLTSPDAYPWRPATVDLIETHISWVFLAGDRVVKVKRPVALPFVDQTTVEARHQLCEDEVRLNARLTDGVYLGVVPVTHAGGRHAVDGSGEPVEWATVMRRLPHDRMLDALVAAGATPDDAMDRLADRLIPFHRDAAGPCPGDSAQQVEEATRVLLDNLDELAQLMEGRPFEIELAMIAEAERAFIAVKGDLLRRRATVGWVRDGHGDLRAEHICMEADGRVQVFDCVEFSQAFRCADVASDLAFLLMDLDRLGMPPDRSARLVERYRAGGIDLPADLLGLYWAHRALVRAKVGAIRMAESGEDDDTPMLVEVARYLHTAASRAIASEPVLVVMSGLSGTGKSTVARELARVLRADHHRSDEIRKARAGIEGSAREAFGEGVYQREMTAATYQRLLELGGAAIRAGRPVILDATFLDGRWRHAAAELARNRNVPMLLVETVTDDAVLEARLAVRAARRDDPSDADSDIMRHQRSRLARKPPGVPAEVLTATIDTTMEGYVDLDPALAVLREAGVLTPRISGIADHP